MKVIPDESTRLVALKRGEVDIAYGIRGELAVEVIRTPGLQIISTVGMSPFWLYFRLPPPLVPLRPASPSPQTSTTRIQTSATPAPSHSISALPGDAKASG